ncbi:MAG: prepilin-type N-terminal cleavage/methylation domain-containing protein [Candidatus Gastranaerophilales bacterium]|nr:prepilin-type N-terminal cleavage/methylation domain-containing protein [Candidatus Gastranaerophilales bacterium]
MHRHKKAFTLAEVLITLLIIGVISSIVIPAIIQDSQDSELRTSWRKAYSDIDQAIRRIVFDQAGNLIGMCSDDNCLKNELSKYLSYSKQCDATSNTTSINGCWHIYNGDSTYKAKYLSNSAVTTSTWYTSPAGLILNNGNLLYIAWYSSTCTRAYGTVNDCALLFVDINGFKAPNTFGKDIYGIHVLNNGIKPFGTSGDSFQNRCTTSTNGFSCAAEYLY